MKLENKYFKLAAHCFIINGEKGYAIYDLHNNNIYSIDSQIGKMIDILDPNNIDIWRALRMEMFKGLKKTKIIKYLDEIVKLGLADYYEKNVIIEKLKPISFYDHNYYKTKRIPLPLQKIWIELNNKCNFNCIHCIDTIKKVKRCSCSVNEIESFKNINFDTIKKIINDVELLGCQEVHIIGGEPLLNKNMVFDLITLARKKKIPKIILQTNLFHFNEEILNFLLNNKVIIQSLLYSYNQERNDSITGRTGSWRKIIDNLKSIRKHPIQIKVLIEIMKENQNDIKLTTSLLNNIGIKDISYSYVLSNNQQIFPSKFSNEIFKTEDNIHGVNANEFFRNRIGNPCWFAKLAITFDGKITPCIMARDIIIENISNASLTCLRQS